MPNEWYSIILKTSPAIKQPIVKTMSEIIIEQNLKMFDLTDSNFNRLIRLIKAIAIKNVNKILSLNSSYKNMYGIWEMIANNDNDKT